MAVAQHELEQVASLGELRELVGHRAAVEARIREAVIRCRHAGVDGHQVAGVLALSLSALYRHYPAGRGLRRRP